MSTMATLFKSVEAIISEDLSDRLPKDLDFEELLRKVCHKAGVHVKLSGEVQNSKSLLDTEGGALDVSGNLGEGCGNLGPVKTETDNNKLTLTSRSDEDSEDLKDIKKSFHLKGTWIAMEKACKELVCFLAENGTHVAESKEGELSLDQANNSSDIQSSSMTQEISHPPRLRPQRVTRRLVRPRMSVMRKGNINHIVDHDKFDIEAEEDDDGNEDSMTSGKSKPLAVKRNKNETNKCKENVHMSLKRGRGRPKKGASPFIKAASQIPGKKRGPYKKSTLLTINHACDKTEETDSLPPRAKRGRPKLGRTRWPCKECSFEADKRSLLRSHRLRMHQGSPTTCDLCKKVFPNKRYMLRHRVTHVAPQHCCDICGKTYKIKNSLIEHRRTHEDDYTKEKVQCEQCPKSFCNRYVLECHIRDVHMGMKKSYLCSECGKSFTSRNSLKEHTDAHTGVRPHTCDICGKSFSYKTALRDHKYTHSDSKEFWCVICDKGFSQRSGLKKHERIHKLGKVFTCTTCGRGFTQKQAMQRHEKIHRNDKVTNPAKTILHLPVPGVQQLVQQQQQTQHEQHLTSQAITTASVATLHSEGVIGNQGITLLPLHPSGSPSTLDLSYSFAQNQRESAQLKAEYEDPRVSNNTPITGPRTMDHSYNGYQQSDRYPSNTWCQAQYQTL